MNSSSVSYEIPYKNIVYFPGIIENISKIISDIEALNSPALTGWNTWFAYGSEGDPYGEIKYMRKAELRDEQSLDVREKAEFVQNTLIDSMVVAIHEYAKIHNIDSDSLNYAEHALKHEGTKFGINKYYEGQFMGPHVDWNEFNSDITYTIVVYLNDNYEGGELYFLDPNIDLKIKPKAGSIVMFPSQLPYLHQSCQIVKGRKMLITHHWKNDSLSKKD